MGTRSSGRVGSSGGTMGQSQLSNAQTLLPHYELLAHISAELVQTARFQEWERVRKLQSHCLAEVQSLLLTAQSLRLTEDERRQLNTVVVSIIRSYAELVRMMHPASQEQVRSPHTVH